jgi:tricorn protease
MILKYFRVVFVAALAIGIDRSGATAYAVNTADTRLLSTPAITEGQIAFVYAGDIWVADFDGANPRRVTSHPGEERSPFFSPDGKRIAFTASYDGNVDVYVIPSEGGEPVRLTWHPGEDIVRGFTPDGQVLFSSQRTVFSRRLAQFFTIGTHGGAARTLPVPSADKGAITRDGKYLAYTLLSEPWRQWKNYRGGTASRIWVLKLDDLSHEEVPKPADGCNDTDPMWVGDTLYFLSDRDGEFNLYSYDRNSRKVARCTEHDSFPIASASSGAGMVIYEQAGWIHRYDPSLRKATRLKIGVAADLAETRRRRASGGKYVRGMDISPTGKRVVLEFRGEIVTVPAKKGDPRDLSHTPGVYERSPAWSPDGKSIAYFSDGSGEYALVVRPQEGKTEGRAYPLFGSGFYERLVWSPDSQKIAFIDNSRTLYWINLATSAVKRIASEPIYGPINTMRYSWSPDSKWLAYTLTNRAAFQAIHLFELEGGKSYPVTDGLAEAGEPVFDAGGKYLFFLASTDAGPVKNWFDQSNADMQATASIYLVTLSRATPNPLLKESDEESPTPSEASRDSSDRKKADAKDSPKDGSDKEDRTKPKPPVVIDIQGLGARVVALPIEAGHFENLTAGAEGQIYYIRRVGMSSGRRPTSRGKGSLRRFDLKSREEEPLAEGIGEFQISADHKKILYRGDEPRPEFALGEAPSGAVVIGVVDAGKFNKGDGALKLETVSVDVEPRSEWTQILGEAWRINRDYFYATNMHGADWNAVRRKYEEFLPHLSSRGDLDRIIRMMLSELSVGHSGSGGGERIYEPKPVPVGLLGADFDVAEGRYRFKTIYGGAFWDTALRAPLMAPGVNVQPGEFLLEVDGKPVNTNSEVYRFFEGTVGKRTELKVGPQADGAGARIVTVEPIADESSLRNRAWVEGNLRKVHERTGGRVAYVYVPNTAEMGHAYFKRYFFPQGDKEAIIIDERFNGGGQVADYYIELLRKPLVSYWATRHGEPIRTPNAGIFGPKVMIIDETAGSGGDLLPWMFRKFGLGKLIGKRTWGGLVGILGFPVLMDGGRVTAPDLAIFTEDGWVVENVGVPPDIEVEQDPAAVAKGQDPQLDRAIKEVLAELAKNPALGAPKRPPFPVRVHRGAHNGAAAAGGGSGH